MSMKASGVWAYQFTQAQLAHLKSRIAGKGKAEVTALVLHEPGVQSVSIQGNTIPTNASNIRIIVVEM
jgi:hypothetical protein